MLEVGGLFFNIFGHGKKNQIFQFLTKGTPYLQNEPRKIYNGWSNFNTVKISFCKVAVPHIKFSIKDIKMTKKRLKMATLPIVSTL